MSDPLNRPGASTMTPSLRLLPYDTTWTARFDAEADRVAREVDRRVGVGRADVHARADEITSFLSPNRPDPVR